MVMIIISLTLCLVWSNPWRHQTHGSEPLGAGPEWNPKIHRAVWCKQQLHLVRPEWTVSQSSSGYHNTESCSPSESVEKYRSEDTVCIDQDVIWFTKRQKQFLSPLLFTVFKHNRPKQTNKQPWHPKPLLVTFRDLQTEVRSSRPHKSFHKISQGFGPAPFSVAQREQGVQKKVYISDVKTSIPRAQFFPPTS